MKTAEGRELNKQNRKRKHEEQKAKAPRAAKETENKDTKPKQNNIEEGNEDTLAAENYLQSQASPLSKKQKKALKRRQQAADVPEVVAPADPSTLQLIADALPTTTATNSTDARPALNELESEYQFTSINIISSSHIQQKVTQALGILSIYPVIPPAKPAVVLFHTKAASAAKLITIAEITKREIGEKGGKWFQYNTICSVMEEKKVRSKRDKGEKKDSEGPKESSAMEVDREVDPESEDEAFETMKTPFERAIEGRPKIRSVPVMTLYLSRVRVDSLRKAYR
jgi:hypothetical protein